MPTFTTRQINQRLGGALLGPGDLSIDGVDRVDQAGAGQITFIGDSRHARDWGRSRASAALISAGLEAEAGTGKALIRVADADLALAELLQMFAPPPPQAAPGIAPGSTVAPSAVLGPDIAVGPGCSIGPRVHIGAGTVLYANVTVLDGAQIGAGCTLWPGCVIRERCLIGADTVIHANATIGSDGFGYRPAPDGGGLVKIPQIGTVEIGAHVEIGAGTCIDRGKFSATRIGDHTKIDNLCQIGHNCTIGPGCVLAGQVGMAGSATIGRGVVMGGKVAIRDHVTIGDGAMLAGGAAVMNDVPAGETWAGYPARPARIAMREHLAMRDLPELVKLLRRRKPADDGA